MLRSSRVLPADQLIARQQKRHLHGVERPACFRFGAVRLGVTASLINAADTPWPMTRKHKPDRRYSAPTATFARCC